MRNLKAVMAYRGTNYHGFQRQSNASTIQETVERALSKVLNEPVVITGCSRTDTGVHANQYCFNVRTNSSIPCINFCRGVNGELPYDISILSCEEAPDSFHARFDCLGKEYIYKLHCSESKNPFAPDLMLHYRRSLDTEMLQRAAAYFVGTYDFAAFCADCTNVKSTIRTVYSFDIKKCGETVIMLVKGNGFLYNMIRIMTGTLLDINEHRLCPEDIPLILKSKNRLNAGRTAPAHGLYLNRVFYDTQINF